MSKSENKNQKGSSTLREDFVRVAKEAVAKYPDLKHLWTMDADKNSCSLMFPKQTENGFDVLIEVSPDGITVLTQGAHQHFDSPEESDESKIKHALALVRDLLTPSMRIKELRAGESAYRWDIEVFHGDKWHCENTTGLLFWNYFGKRSERIFQNATLPSRLNDVN